MMPEWEKFQAKHKVNSNVNVKKINCSENPEEAESNGINGFPTVILFKGNAKKVYDGERTQEALETFIKEH